MTLIPEIVRSDEEIVLTHPERFEGASMSTVKLGWQKVKKRRIGSV